MTRAGRRWIGWLGLALVIAASGVFPGGPPVDVLLAASGTNRLLRQGSQQASVGDLHKIPRPPIRFAPSDEATPPELTTTTTFSFSRASFRLPLEFVSVRLRQCHARLRVGNADSVPSSLLLFVIS